MSAAFEPDMDFGPGIQPVGEWFLCEPCETVFDGFETADDAVAAGVEHAEQVHGGAR